uniref:Uncharacterized protein n=1 Tax=Rhinolophus ferrumequinum TaxID=59479 RepID=A0A671DS62_RHIFE
IIWICTAGLVSKNALDHLSLLQGPSMPPILVFRRLALPRCPLFLKSAFLELIPLLTLKRLGAS